VLSTFFLLISPRDLRFITAVSTRGRHAEHGHADQQQGSDNEDQPRRLSADHIAWLPGQKRTRGRIELGVRVLIEIRVMAAVGVRRRRCTDG